MVHKLERETFTNHFHSPKYHIVMLRALPGLGDLLCAVPAWRTLRAAFPEAHITLIGLAETGGLVARYSHYIDALLPFPGFPGIPEKKLCVSQTLSFLTAMQGRFDLALQMHGSGLDVNTFTLLLGAQRSAGFYPPDHACPDRNSYLPYPRHLSEVQRYLTLLSFLGIPSQGDKMEFPLQQQDYDDTAVLTASGLWPTAPYICLHPGASHPQKQWSVSGFAQVGDTLAREGYQVVLTGTIIEAPLATAVANAMQQPALNLAGLTSLGALALLLHGSQLLVCNDTGVSHLAAALQVPSVITFVQSDSVPRWAPPDRQQHRPVVLTHKNDSPSIWLNKQLLNADITAVLDEAHTLLNQEVLHVG